MSQMFFNLVARPEGVALLGFGGLVWLGLHLLCARRWWIVRKLKRQPPVTGIIRAINKVEDSEGGISEVMTVAFTPEVGPDAGKLVSTTEHVRVFARYETTVGQRVQVHVDPHVSGRVYIPVAAQFWIPLSIMLFLLDLGVVGALIHEHLTGGVS